MNPYVKLVKKNDNIYLTRQGDIKFEEVALGVYTYCQSVAEETNADPESLKSLFIKILTAIQSDKPREEIKLNNESEEGYVEV